jgi:3-oxoadipate enol-lactonase
MHIKANGIDVYYEITGAGPWLTFSHSLATDSSMWAGQVAEFSKRFRVLAYDTRGHGRTSAPAGAYNLAQLATDLKALLDALSIRQTHFVGLSMGGMIGQTFALEHAPVLKSLTLADTTSRYGPEAEALWSARIKTALEQGMEPLVEPTLGRWLTEPYRKAYPDRVGQVAAMIRNTPVSGYVGCCHALPKINVTSRLKELELPILVVCGEQDMGTPTAMAEEIHRNAPGSELVILPNAAHLSNLEQPARFNQALSNFLTRHA